MLDFMTYYEGDAISHDQACRMVKHIRGMQIEHNKAAFLSTSTCSCTQGFVCEYAQSLIHLRMEWAQRARIKSYLEEIHEEKAING
jgi:hypothetical protein